jgi:tRNA modification GTPase
MAAGAMDDSLQIDDTIAALASAPGPAARGIVRVSGKRVDHVLSELFRPDDADAWRSARRASRHPGAMTMPGLHLPLRVDVLLWPTTRSYTGQPLAEIHTIGSPPLLEGILSALFAEHVRPARRGEFTLRAFLAGRIDLLQAEAVLGVIDASDQQQLSLALSQLGGGLSDRIATLHEELLLHLADLEAGLDFVEEDIEFVSREELARRLAEAETFVEQLADQSQRRLQSTGRRRVVLAGLPNAGKSTLFNALVGDERAIVSHVAGTTRDYLSAPLTWDGLAIELIDTAGWDSISPGISRSADELRQQQWDRADLVVWCSARDMTAEQQRQDLSLRQAFAKHHPPLVVTTKADCAPQPHSTGGRVRSEADGPAIAGQSQASPPVEPRAVRHRADAPDIDEHARPLTRRGSRCQGSRGPSGTGPMRRTRPAADASRLTPPARQIDDYVVSATTGEGLDPLRTGIRQRLQSAEADSEVLGSTAARCRESLNGALAAMQQARRAADAGLGDELIALELREAIDHLGKIAGRIYTDDVLDRIFSRFCIGK